MVLCLLSSSSLSLPSLSLLTTVGKNGSFIRWGRPPLIMLSPSSLATVGMNGNLIKFVGRIMAVGKNGNLIKRGRRRCWTIGLKNGAAGLMISTIVGLPILRLCILCWHVVPVKPCKHRHVLRPTHCPPF